MLIIWSVDGIGGLLRANVFLMYKCLYFFFLSLGVGGCIKG